MILAGYFMYVLLNKEIYSLALYIVVLLSPMGDQYYSEWVTLLSSIYVHNFICIYLIIINILLLLIYYYKKRNTRSPDLPFSYYQFGQIVTETNIQIKH